MGIVIDSSVFITVKRTGNLFNPEALGIGDEPIAIAALKLFHGEDGALRVGA